MLPAASTPGTKGGWRRGVRPLTMPPSAKLTPATETRMRISPAAGDGGSISFTLIPSNGPNASTTAARIADTSSGLNPDHSACWSAKLVWLQSFNTKTRSHEGNHDGHQLVQRSGTNDTI